MVANDGIFLYVTDGPYGLPLVKVNGATGVVLATSNLSARSAALSSDAATLYVAGPEGIAALDAATLTVKNSVSTGPCGAGEAVLSPDNSMLYSYLYGEPGCFGDPPECNGAQQCAVAFSTNTLALEWSIPNVGSALSLSNDGSTLYAVYNVYPPLQYPVHAIDTATQTITTVPVPVPGTETIIATSPVSHFAVVVSQGKTTSSGGEVPAAAYLLNTATNKLVRTLFSQAPGNTVVKGAASQGVAIAPDGKSVWMVLRCAAGSGCTLTEPYLAGFSLPLARQIAFEPLQNQSTAPDDVIAFPRAGN